MKKPKTKTSAYVAFCFERRPGIKSRFDCRARSPLEAVTMATKHFKARPMDILLF